MQKLPAACGSVLTEYHVSPQGAMSELVGIEIQMQTPSKALGHSEAALKVFEEYW